MLKELSKEQQLMILGLILSIVIGIGVVAFRHLGGSGDSEIAIEYPQAKNPEATAYEKEIMVHISGAVRREGVYKLKFDDRVVDVIKLAGGAMPQADLSAINLAEMVKDGEKIVIPLKVKVAERISGNPAIGGSGTPSGKVNLNSADDKEFDKLPGIGPSTARAIVEYRQKKGAFAKIEQIMEVPRIGKSKFEKIKDYLTI